MTLYYEYNGPTAEEIMNKWMSTKHCKQKTVFFILITVCLCFKNWLTPYKMCLNVTWSNKEKTFYLCMSCAHEMNWRCIFEQFSACKYNFMYIALF